MLYSILSSPTLTKRGLRTLLKAISILPEKNQSGCSQDPAMDKNALDEGASGSVGQVSIPEKFFNNINNIISPIKILSNQYICHAGCRDNHTWLRPVP